MTHYFDEHPGVPSGLATVDVVLGDVAFTMFTDRGVFSHGQLDTGTSLLLREAPPAPTSGQLLDLGCGSGAIALALARRSPAATVWAVDVNRRALELTAANAERNGIENVRAVAPDEVPDDVRFACIRSTPPIRIGKPALPPKPALHDLLLCWLGRLAAGADAVLVVQKHLGADSLQRWLGEQGYTAQRIASRAGYRLLQVWPGGLEPIR